MPRNFEGFEPSTYSNRSGVGIKPEPGFGMTREYKFVEGDHTISSGGAVLIDYQENEIAKISDATARNGLEVVKTSVPFRVEVRNPKVTNRKEAVKHVRTIFDKWGLSEEIVSGANRQSVFTD
jgi:hypothetical protein